MPSGVSVLVIDDEVSIRESLTAFLEDYGFMVDSAESAEDALRMLEQVTCDLAVVDMRLPGESGESFIIKANSVHPDMKFLIHTGSVEFQLGNELKNLGILPEDVYIKPVQDLGILVEGIRRLLPR